MRILPLALLLAALPASAQPAPAPAACDGTCLSEEERKVVVDGLKELRSIKESEAEIRFKDPIVIIRDWEDRVYINGGEKRPLRLTLKLGTVERELEATVPVQVSYREKPPDPLFRLRFRAQGGAVIPRLFQSPKDGFDVGLGLDFFHLGVLNLSAHAGFRSVGGGLGLDLTKNFGPYVGYSILYDGWRSGLLAGAYFSFN